MQAADTSESRMPAQIDFAVLGMPIAHSLSPRIHQKFAQTCGIKLHYQAIPVAAADLATFLSNAHQQRARGFNLTMPHKQAALALCSELTPRAKAAGAVNTLIRTNAGWQGDNTDGIGFVRDLTLRHHFQLKAARVLIIGAGGAASGVLPALLEAGVAEVHIANRSVEKASALAARWANTHKVVALKLGELADFPAFDLVINASGAGYQDSELSLPETLLEASGLAYDLSYGKAAMPFLRWACEIECTAVDGLGMLIEQAAEAFFLWHGVRVDTAGIWAELRVEV
jgi:shikimate dehydrogenase